MDVVLAGIIGIILSAVILGILCRRRAAQAYEYGRVSIEPERTALSERLRSREADVARLASELQGAQTRYDAAAAELREEAQRRAAAEQAAGRVPQLERA